MLFLVATLCNAVLIAFSHECGIAPVIYKDFDFLDVVNGPSGRILNGQRVAEHALPFVASLGFNIGPKTDLGCTASIIAPQYVLTAAHCFFQTKLPVDVFLKVTSVHYGSKYFKKSRKVRVADIFFTSRSNSESYEDILVLKLAEPIEFDYKTVAPVCLSYGANPDIFGNVLVAGFGNHSFTEQKFGKPEEYLVEVLPVKKGRYCNANSHEFCAGGVEKGTMEGDSGGPVLGVYDGRFFQVGLVARGRTDREYMVDKTGYYHDEIRVDHGTYTKVFHYCGFIEKVTEGHARCVPLKN